MRTAHTLCPVGSVFVAAGLVTADRWAGAAAGTGSAAEVLARLAAESEDDGAQTGPAVTTYHARLVAQLGTAGALDQLPRRLRWGRFAVLSELGRGGMGVVYRAWDTQARTLVALKRVRAAGREMRQRFQRESRVLALLDHPGIAKFYGTEAVGGVEMLVMEYVPGVTASRAVRRLAKQGRAVPCETAVHWVAQTLSALAHAHDRHVVHRDIKPGNLMVTPDGRLVKLLDMGLAKCLNDPAEGDGLTRCGQAVGTREYMPPEQWLGVAVVTPAADLYALGCTLFSLLAGRPPFDGDTTYKQMNQHLHAPVPSVRAVRPDVPVAVDEVIQRLMAKNPAHRGTAREIAWLLTRRIPVAAALAAPQVEPRTPPAPAHDSTFSADASRNAAPESQWSTSARVSSGAGQLSGRGSQLSTA
ncbi:MAG: serine/threonine-protein kinase, partial [Gemmata sp.]